MELDFEIDQLIRIPVYLNGKGPYEFHLDIGAGSTIVSEDLADRLELEGKASSKTAKTAGGEMKVKTAVLESFTIGENQFFNEEIIISDMSKLQRACSSFANGVIGHSFLKKYHLVINYPNKKLKLLQEPAIVKGLQSFEYLLCTHVVTIEVEVNGTGPHIFALDTGASGSLINTDFVKEVGLSLEKSEFEVMSPSGPLETYETKVDSIQSQFKSMNEQKLPVAPLSHLSQGSDRILAGILGYDFLKGTELIIDYPNQKIAIVPQN
ncbi:MAG: retropepsin-like aspartic protease [Candidatus Kariarchaeaceae archaeon]|jgi:predicted aspartyl protease